MTADTQTKRIFSFLSNDRRTQTSLETARLIDMCLRQAVAACAQAGWFLPACCIDEAHEELFSYLSEYRSILLKDALADQAYCQTEFGSCLAETEQP